MCGALEFQGPSMWYWQIYFMKLSFLFEDVNRFIVWKWVAGTNWKVHTVEGKVGEGGSIIPLWVCGDFDSVNIFWSLVYNNATSSDEMYLAEISVDYDPNLLTTKKFTTYEYSDIQKHSVGSRAFVGREMF